MTHYQQHIVPRLHVHPEWKSLVNREAELRERLEEVQTQRINFETAFIARAAYPTAED